MAVSESILAELERLGVTGWQRDIALSLADQMDAEPNASVSRELRLLMKEIGSTGTSVKQVSALDELKQKRERRRFAASGSERS